MRIATATFALLFFTALVCAWQLPSPAWLFGLYAAPALGALMAAGLVLLLFELLLGPSARAVVPAVAIALGLFAALFAEFEAVFDLLARAESLPLDQVGKKLLASGAIGAALGALWLGSYGLRAPYRASQIASVVGLTLAVYALAFVPSALQIAFPAPWMCALFTLTAALIALLSWQEGRHTSQGTEE